MPHYPGNSPTCMSRGCVAAGFHPRSGSARCTGPLSKEVIAHTERVTASVLVSKLALLVPFAPPLPSKLPAAVAPGPWLCTCLVVTVTVWGHIEDGPYQVHLGREGA
jgi:hypothetical protein